MQKFSMWKREPNNKTLPTSLLPMERQQKEAQYPLVGKDYELEKMMRFLGEMGKFEDI